MKRNYTVTFATHCQPGAAYSAVVVRAESSADARRQAERAAGGLFIVDVHRTP